MKNEELGGKCLFLRSWAFLFWGERGDPGDQLQQTGSTGGWVNMSDDIRRKKKKAGRKKEAKPAEAVVRKETEVIQENPSPDPSPEPDSRQEKQSVLGKTLFFSAILGETLWPVALSFQPYFITGVVGLIILAVSGNLLQPDSLARLGEDSFLPDLQQLNLGLESVSSLSSALAQNIPSVQQLSDAIVEVLSFPFSSETSAVDESEAGDDLEQTKEVEDHEKIITTAGSHLNTEETVSTTETLQESSTNSLKEDKVNKV